MVFLGSARVIIKRLWAELEFDFVGLGKIWNKRWENLLCFSLLLEVMKK